MVVTVSKLKLVLNCGHHFYAKLQLLTREFGVKNVEVMCDRCGHWVKCREVNEHQMRLDYGSETTSVAMGESQPTIP